MKRTRSSLRRSRPEEPRSEYEFDYAAGRNNRFASKLGPQTVAVVLEPDVAHVFSSSRSVNQLLRSVIKAVPRGEAASRGRRKAG